MNGEITFDTQVDELGQDHIEGCYRIGGEDWKVFYFTHWFNGDLWSGDPVIKKDAVWQSGITGVNAVLPKEQRLNKTTVLDTLSELLGVQGWSEVRGPDSLQLK